MDDFDHTRWNFRRNRGSKRAPGRSLAQDETRTRSVRDLQSKCHPVKVAMRRRSFGPNNTCPTQLDSRRNGASRRSGPDTAACPSGTRSTWSARTADASPRAVRYALLSSIVVDLVD
jgi:hypothetical protein